MTNSTPPDIFTQVHKGIRSALFTACTGLGRAGRDPASSSHARAQLRQVLRFVSHHGENEDLLLFPTLAERATHVFRQLEDEHHKVHGALHALLARIDTAPTHELYLEACDFTALYLQHLSTVEMRLESAIRQAHSPDELIAFGKKSVERTAPADQQMMLGWILPAMTRQDAELFLSRLPPALQEVLRAGLKEP